MPGPPSLRQRLSAATIDTAALRSSAAFRRMFTAQLVSSIGTQVTLVALMYLVYELTGSTLKVGLLGLSMVVPTLTLALLGGAITDAMDRRRLLLLVQAAMASSSLTLAWVAALDSPPLWSLYVLAALSSSFAAIDGPARTAVLPSLVAPEHLRSAVQLREVLTQSGRTFGPIIGGTLIAAFGVPLAFLVDGITFGFAFAMFLGLPALMPTTRRRFELSSITEGLRFVGKRPVLAATFYADIIAMVFGQQRALFPAYASTIFAVGPAGLGLLYAAPSAGAMVGILFLGLLRSVRREGLAVLVCVGVWGACIALFGAAPWLWLALLALALAGWADMVSAVFRQTILLSIVPDELRGRMGSVHIMVVTGGPPIGDMASGTAGELIGIRQASIAGGLACIGGVLLLAARVPGFARWTLSQPPPGDAEEQPAP